MPSQSDIVRTVEALRYLTHVVSTGLIEPLDLLGVVEENGALKRFDLAELEQLQGWLEVFRQALANRRDKSDESRPSD